MDIGKKLRDARNAAKLTHPCGSGLKWKKCTCAQYHPEGSNGGEN